MVFALCVILMGVNLFNETTMGTFVYSYSLLSEGNGLLRVKPVNHARGSSLNWTTLGENHPSNIKICRSPTFSSSHLCSAE